MCYPNGYFPEVQRRDARRAEDYFSAFDAVNQRYNISLSFQFLDTNLDPFLGVPVTSESLRDI